MYRPRVIAGIVLAAGLSERMGGVVPKQLLPVRGIPMVTVAAANAAESSLDHVVVVTGHHADEVAAAVADLDIAVVQNPEYREGNMTSLRAGYRMVPSADAYLILLADMPGVDAGIIDRFVGAWRDRRPWAAVAAYSDGKAHPLLLSAAAMEQAAQANGPKAVWKLLGAAEPGAVDEVTFDHPAPADVNTPTDYDAIREP